MKLSAQFTFASLLALFCGTALAAPVGSARDEPSPARHTPSDKLVVHEWGTFTALQDEQGRTIRGINTDDEPLPNFVHNAHGNVLQNPSDIPPVQFKGVSRVHPDVIVRLETPVLYFYPPRGHPEIKLDVKVDFKGGWLTQYYPDAKATNPNLQQNNSDPGNITPGTVSSLAWNDLKVAGRENGPVTQSRVWLAPREVEATSVRATNGEAERYVFYRGVGRMDPPVRVARDEKDKNRLNLFVTKGKSIGPAWLVDVRHDGAIALRSIGAIEQKEVGEPGATTPATFADREYATDNLKEIRRELKAALIKDGLYDDEAEAMMNTWQASYFQRPGLRVFFMVPDAWTDNVLPLSITAGGLAPNMDVQRAMIGRIELVTPAQRERLQRVSQTPPADGGWLWKALEKMQASKADAYREDWYRQIFSGERSLLSENIEMPPEFRDYLQLGRFRNALILDELSRRPTANLDKFVKQYALEYSRTMPEETTAAAAAAAKDTKATKQ